MELLTNKETRITSVELVEIINELRIEESKIHKKKCIKLKHKNLIRKIRNEMKVLESLGMDGQLNFKPSTYIDIMNRENFCYSLNSQAVKYIMDSCNSRDKIAIAKVFNSMANGKEISICKNRPEYEFGEVLFNAIKPFGIEDIKTQYYCCGNKYRIDYYIPSLNVAIEYDENGHVDYTYEQHEGRQIEIEKELGCRFIRVTDKNNLFFNIGYVLKEMVS